ncbi:hypothetical protein HNQ56_003793 [Anaerotaenia torta]|uniref:hypothetical protein n=1 Tax=Anaerotaenia torta TaxID=433293 RepID=UPI003D1D7315
MNIYDYKQDDKNFVRHRILSHAIEALTVERHQACCVPRKYVRQIIDYFLQLDEGEPARKEVEEIQSTYFSAWESLHDSVIGYKRPSDLSVCYLSGPQPENDFNELISLGVLPQNIWAFENDKETYLKAVDTYNTTAFPQPKIVKMSIEQFFKQSPKKFDIVYIDACGAIISTQHALRCAATLFYHQRLNSPGVLITNFAKPDITKESIKVEYAKMIALYMLFKQSPNVNVSNNEKNSFSVDNYEQIYQEVQLMFDDYYDRFITCILSDLASIIIPLQRFGELAPYSNLFTMSEIEEAKSSTNLEIINSIKNNSVCKWILTMDLLLKKKSQNECKFNSNLLYTDLVGLDGSWDKLVRGVRFFIALKNGCFGGDVKIASIGNFFDTNQNIYQFLDRPSASLFFDVVINQLAYPLHSNEEKRHSYKYCAKSTDMFTDLVIYDECRYLYEWLPAIHQIENAMRNKSWQYIFRFALDGLVKQRINYNNEFFFQGSVISKDELESFKAKVRRKREIIGG